MGYAEILGGTDAKQQKVFRGHGGNRERAATALGLGEGAVKVDFELGGGKGGVLANRGGGRAQQQHRQHHREQGTSGSTETVCWSH